MVNYTKYLVFIFAILSLFLITGCESDVGENCGYNGLFNVSCVTDNCYNGTCYSNYEGGYCEKEDHCWESFCINNICSQKNELNGPCEYNYHCNEGICKDYSCQLGEKGDSCSKSKDCSEGFECNEEKCISSKWYCEAARFFGIGGGTVLLAIILLIIGGIGVYFGFNIMGGNIIIGGITIAISIFVLAVAFGIIGVGILSVCY